MGKKFRKSHELSGLGKLGLFVAGVAILGGCGRKVGMNAQLKPGASPSAEVDDQSQAPDLSRVSMKETNLHITDASVMAYEVIHQNLTLRMEEYVNSNAETVWIWIHPSVSGLHFWGVCSGGRGQYQTDPGLVSMQPHGGDLVSKRIVANDWSVLELPGNSSVSVEWVIGGGWHWIEGPLPAPQESCNESSPERGWSGFDIEGEVFEQIRISLPKVTWVEGTGSANFLDSSRVLALPDVQESLSEHWGDWP